MNRGIMRLGLLSGLLFSISVLATPLGRNYSEPVTEAQYLAAKSAMDAFIHSTQIVLTDPSQEFYKREHAQPYFGKYDEQAREHKLHPIGQRIRGTVLLFHGFTSRPHQMAVLHEYLFKLGFNVYNCGLPNHHQLPGPSLVYTPDPRQWPQVVLKKELRDRILAIYNDTEKRNRLLAKFLVSGNTNPLGGSQEEQSAFLMQVQQIIDSKVPNSGFNVLEFYSAYRNPNGELFKKYFLDGHRKYVEYAQARLKEVEPLPGPKYALGLSVGGTVALALAATEPEKIDGVVAWAPLLRTFGEENRMKVLLVGPSNQVMTQNRGAHFNVSSYTAAEVFGMSVLNLYASNEELSVPTFMVLTESDWETAADIDASRRFFQGIKGRSNQNVLYEYRPEHRVPHALADPKEATVGDRGAANGILVTNEYWRSLYKETARFFADGKVEVSNLETKEGDPDLRRPEDNRTFGFIPSN